MLLLALKMLIGNKSSCIGIIFGVFLSTLLISQQSAIFLGLITRSYRMITDIPAPNVWVVDPATESDDRFRAMPDAFLDIVRSTEGIEWAMPIGRSSVSLITPTGIFEICRLYGVDDATLVGAPAQIIEGDVQDLRREGGIIVDVYSANDSLASRSKNGELIPLKVGDELEINSRRAVVVGICQITQGFYPQPIIFTTFSQFRAFNPSLVNSLAYIAAKTSQEADFDQVIGQIKRHPSLHAMSKEQFRDSIVRSFLKTGILINFGLSVALGIIIGFSIAGQLFYSMTLENMMYYALIKSVGGTNRMVFSMIILQAIVAAIIGFLLGIGTTLLWGQAIQGTTLAFLFPWQLLALTGLIILVICLFTAGLSIYKISHTDPKVLMGN
ncbi:MAG: ABC transporter permease [Parachlamydia sp.]|jgi:putative ABC transport system permease protein|nr:ABC transporter permease [Parachlamydia sp.]